LNLRVGIVGVGFGSVVHVPAFRAEGFDVVAICARGAEALADAAQKWGIAQTYTDVLAMVQNAEIDVISVAAPVAAHYPIAVAALRKGKHVICEKPFALNSTEARGLWREAQLTTRTAMIAHEFRFSPARMRAHELIQEGYIGSPRMCLVRLLLAQNSRLPQYAAEVTPPYIASYDDAMLGAGFLFSFGSHYVDALRHWLGDVTFASATLETFRSRRMAGDRIVHADADDTLAFTLKFASGATAHVIGARQVPFGRGASIEIYGTDGALFLPQSGVNPNRDDSILGARLGDEQPQELTIPERLREFSDDRDARLFAFRSLLRQFRRGIARGESPAPNFFDGYRCQQILDAIRTSSSTGIRVAIEAPSRGSGFET
jgi:predicted dehydrogenase